MNLKNSLKSNGDTLPIGSKGVPRLAQRVSLRRGQAALEYFILLAIIAGLTVLSLSTFFPNVKTALQGKDGFFQVAVERIIK